MARRKRIDPAKARAAVGGDPGWYQNIKVPPRTYNRCGRCSEESATVPAPGELCLVCKLKERKAAREASA